jgi:hypothetical protein
MKEKALGTRQRAYPPSLALLRKGIGVRPTQLTKNDSEELGDAH